MITQVSITGAAWTAITSAGESGTCWLDEQDDGASGQVDVRITNGETTPADEELTKAKLVYKPRGNDDVLLIAADGVNDIFWARCSREDDTAIISVSVV